MTIKQSFSFHVGRMTVDVEYWPGGTAFYSTGGAWFSVRHNKDAAPTLCALIELEITGHKAQQQQQ
jgi:hypothetical protein